jgi:serine/threonine protein kinase
LTFGSIHFEIGVLKNEPALLSIASAFLAPQLSLSQQAHSEMARQGTNEGSKEPTTPRLRSSWQPQVQPEFEWITVQQLGAQGGGCNGGIAKVKFKGDPYPKRCFIEKRFHSQLVQQKMARKEICLLRQLGDWPGVVKMVDHYLDEPGKKASVWLEYCDGGDLQDLISKCRRQNQRVHERKIWNWFTSLMDALVYLHRGPDPENDRDVLLYWNIVYHCDIKPANIFLKIDEKQGKIVAKLADFGCSQSVHWAQVAKPKGKIGFASALTPVTTRLNIRITRAPQTFGSSHCALQLSVRPWWIRRVEKIPRVRGGVEANQLERTIPGSSTKYSLGA